MSNSTKHIVFTVTNDLAADQRMFRICETLTENGYDVTLVGREKKNSLPLTEQPFKQKRIKCRNEKGKLFYLEYNFRLYRYLLKTKCDAICSVDLDTLLAGYKASNKKKIKLIYDSHEYFTEQYEVATRPKVQKAWTNLEERIISKIKYAYTVNQSIADIYQKKYNTPFEVIQNVPVLKSNPESKSKKNLIYIGAVNQGRGLEMLIDCMKDIPTRLYICGGGDIIEPLMRQVEKADLTEKVIFTGFMTPQELQIKTQEGYIGVNILDKVSLSYYYSLANKFFDYIHACIPQITVNFPEYKRINDEFEVAQLVDMNREQIVEAAKNLLENKNEVYDKLKANTQKAKKHYNWQNESKKLLSFYEKVFQS